MDQWSLKTGGHYDEEDGTEIKFYEEKVVSGTAQREAFLCPHFLSLPSATSPHSNYQASRYQGRGEGT